MKPDGIFLSNYPVTQSLLRLRYRRHSSCFGSQTADFWHLPLPPVARTASGAKTLKMKFTYHGANHPVQDLDSGQVLITSQNHGFAADEATLPANLRTTHKSLFDGSLQRHRAH